MSSSNSVLTTLQQPSLDLSRFKKGKTGGNFRVCIIDVAKGFTIEATHPLPGQENKSAEEKIVEYPHDADEVLKALDSSIEIETLYLKPNPRQAISQIARRADRVDVFFNLYDLSDTTGQSIVDYMEKNGIAFTGAGSRFYDPPREDLKRLCRYYSIDTPPYAFISVAQNIEQTVQELDGFPLFCKPAHGYDSVGIDEKSIMTSIPELKARAAKICDEFGSALVEKFINGREFSVLVAGTKGKCFTFPPVEYEFPKERTPVVDLKTPTTSTSTTSNSTSNTVQIAVTNPSSSPSTSTDEKQPEIPISYLTFEDKWGSNYQSRWKLLDDSPLNRKLAIKLQEMGKSLFEAFEGEGFARIDIRSNEYEIMERKKRGENVTDDDIKLFVLDINPNCSLFYKDECTADTIMRLVGWTKPKFMALLLDHALNRQAKFTRFDNIQLKYSATKKYSLVAKRPLPKDMVVYSDEMQPIRLVTREWVLHNWPADEVKTFLEYAWPVGFDTFAIWDIEPAKWRPINHSCDPNCIMVGLDVRARKDIAQGEELTLDYATFLPYHPQFQCWCGAKNCRKKLSPGEYREAYFKKTYGQACSPFIRGQLEQEEMMVRVAKQAVASALEHKSKGDLSEQQLDSLVRDLVGRAVTEQLSAQTQSIISHGRMVAPVENKQTEQKKEELREKLVAK